MDRDLNGAITAPPRIARERSIRIPARQVFIAIII
jgi:hypothetical protein